MTGNDEIIRVHELSKNYELKDQIIAVLRKISFKVYRGDYVAIMGQSGSGKSTLLNILGCLDLPSTGEYFLNGKQTTTISEIERALLRNYEIGFVFQNFNLLPKLTVSENIELPLIYAGINAKNRFILVEDALVRLGLWERRKHKPNEISGGQKQRVAIARALVKKPSLILADEPTGNLDSHTSNEILDIFDMIINEGNAILMITHEPDVAKRTKRIIRLVDGQIMQ
jgi:putative ABC transport system ATP-binding protein